MFNNGTFSIEIDLGEKFIVIINPDQKSDVMEESRCSQSIGGHYTIVISKV